MRYLLLLLTLAACASTDYVEFEAPPGTAEEPAAEPPRPEFPTHPDLGEVLERVEAVPRLAAAHAAVLREQGDLRQAGLSPNPEIRFAAERWPTDDLSDGPGKRTVRLTQRIETGGKRSGRKRIGEWRVREASAQEALERNRVAEAAAEAHQAALAAFELAAVREAQLRGTEELLALRRALVESGREKEGILPPLQAELGALRVALAEERARHRAALRRLEGILALPVGTLQGVRGGLLLEAPLADAADALEKNPELAARKAAEKAAASGVEHARSLAAPDVIVGLSYENRTDSLLEPGQNLGIMLGLPIPIVDRNQGGVQAAQAELSRAIALREESEARVRARYSELVELVAALQANRKLYADEIVPARERDFALAEAGFAAGRLDRVGVVEASLRLSESRAELLEIETRLSALLLETLALLGYGTGNHPAKSR